MIKPRRTLSTCAATLLALCGLSLSACGDDDGKQPSAITNTLDASATGQQPTGDTKPNDGGNDAGQALGPVGMDAAAPTGPFGYILSSVVIDADGNRTTYVQAISSLDQGPFNNKNAIEMPGNGVTMANDSAFFAGLAEEPTWVRYALDASGKLKETGRMSLLGVGAKQIDYGNALVDDQTAVSVLTNPALAVIWNPTTMTITGQVDLSFLTRTGYELEVWTTISEDGLVYIPGRLSDWTGNRIYPSVSTTILDPKAMRVVGTAVSDRCASGGRVVFGSDGYAYVLGDGRTYSIQMFANASGGIAPDNCLLRIAPGSTEFDPNYYYTIKSLTGGLEAIGELETTAQKSGVGFVKIFYPDKLPANVKPVDFDFWNYPAHKNWRLTLGNPPTAEEVQGAPFSAIGFTGAVLDGRLYNGESTDSGQTNDVYETDPNTNTATIRFKMDGYFNGLNRLKVTP